MSSKFIKASRDSLTALVMASSAGVFLPPAARVDSPPATATAVHVAGYTLANGTRVNDYWRSPPDDREWNNWSALGNVNPVTGRQGMRRN